MIKRILSIAVLAFLFASFTVAKAQDSTVSSDPAITNLLVINSQPAPGGLVDYTVFFENFGSENATNLFLSVDYDETQLQNISLGDPAACRDDGDLVTCNSTLLTPLDSRTLGFTAEVIPTVSPGANITTTATITADVNEVLQNDFQTVVVRVVSEEAGGTVIPEGPTPVEPTELEPLDSPATKQGVTVLNVQNNPEWQVDRLTTAGLKFMIRGKEALAWTLNIEEAGFGSPALQSTYLRVLTVVNSLFIIGLLAIAVMWMFSLLIPRQTLRKTVLVFGLAVLFVNFALPINQLLIDGTNLLQRTFLDGVNVSTIVETPGYSDAEAVAYQNEAGVIREPVVRSLNLNLSGELTQEVNDVVIGKLQQDFLTPSFTGTINYIDDSGIPQEQVLQLRSTGNDHLVRLNTAQTIEVVDEVSFNPNQEQSIFAFSMLLFTGTAYFGIALIFLLRIVILWALMIVSPVLFVLAIFRSTRSTFVSWIFVYARWLFIGPLMAIGIGLMVGIWQTVGLPVSSSYSSFGEFGQLSNIGFYLPGSTTVNTLSNTSQMMEYLLFLIMLYLPILLAFMLTRQKLWSAATRGITERVTQSASTAPVTVRTDGQTVETREAEAKSPEGRLRNFLSTNFSGVNRAIPSALKPSAPAVETRERTANNRSDLTSNLQQAPLRTMLQSVVDQPEAPDLQEQATRELASIETVQSQEKREELTAIRNEIETRASLGQPEAIQIANDIRTYEEKQTVTKEEKTRSEKKPQNAKMNLTPKKERTKEPGRNTRKKHKKTDEQ